MTAPYRVRKNKKRRNERRVKLRSLRNLREAIELLGVKRGLTKSQLRAARELFKRGCTFTEYPSPQCYVAHSSLLETVPQFARERFGDPHGYQPYVLVIPPEMWVEAAGWVRKAKKPRGNKFDNAVRDKLKPSFLRIRETVSNLGCVEREC